MNRYAFDIEADGLLDTITQIHCIVLKDLDTGEVLSFGPTTPDFINGAAAIKAAAIILQSADLLVGHNIINYDLQAIKKLYPWFEPEGDIRDTLVISRLIWTNLFETDAPRVEDGRLPKGLWGRHSLKAWGYRMGVLKGDFAEDADWSVWTPEMQAYCEQDVEVTAALWSLIETKGYSERSIDLEHAVASLCSKMTANGFLLDIPKATKLWGELAARKVQLETDIRQVFKPWWVPVVEFTPKRDNLKAGYTAGVPFTKVELQEFNPGSREQITDRLKKIHGWVPKVFTDSGQAKVDEEILKKLPYPEAQILCEYFTVQKRLGQLAEGDKAWLKYADAQGFIHGEYITNGAVTGRATHRDPNMAQVPATGALFGEECRDLFTVPKGYTLVGADMSGLELRCLGHYMAKFDGGAYVNEVLNGDIHWVTVQALGLVPKGTLRDDSNPTLKKYRDVAKRFIYAFLYGAGDAKLGSLFGKGPQLGKKLKERFLANLPALGKLKAAIEKYIDKHGYLVGLDGRILHIRSKHSALNTLLQSAGAILCKQWIVKVNDTLLSEGRKHGWGGDYAFCAWSHDEIQIATKKDFADHVGNIAVRMAQETGEDFQFRCPLTGEYKSGASWRYTH